MDIHTTLQDADAHHDKNFKTHHCHLHKAIGYEAAEDKAFGGRGVDATVKDMEAGSQTPSDLDDVSLLDPSRPENASPSRMAIWALQKLLSPLATNDQIRDGEGHQALTQQRGVRLRWVKALGNRAMSNGLNATTINVITFHPSIGTVWCAVCRACHPTLRWMVPVVPEGQNDTSGACAICFCKSTKVKDMNKLRKVCVSYLVSPRVVQECIVRAVWSCQLVMPTIVLSGTAHCVLDMLPYARFTRAGLEAAVVNPMVFVDGSARLMNDQCTLEWKFVAANGAEHYDAAETFFDLGLRDTLLDAGLDMFDDEMRDRGLTMQALGPDNVELELARESMGRRLSRAALASMRRVVSTKVAATFTNSSVECVVHVPTSVDYTRHLSTEMLKHTRNGAVAVAAECMKVFERQSGTFADWQPTKSERVVASSTPPVNSFVEGCHGITDFYDNRQRNQRTILHDARMKMKMNKVVERLTIMYTANSNLAHAIMSTSECLAPKRTAEAAQRRASLVALRASRKSTLMARRHEREEHNAAVRRQAMGVHRDVVIDVLYLRTTPVLLDQVRAWRASQYPFKGARKPDMTLGTRPSLKDVRKDDEYRTQKLLQRVSILQHVDIRAFPRVAQLPLLQEKQRAKLAAQEEKQKVKAAARAKKHHQKEQRTAATAQRRAQRQAHRKRTPHVSIIDSNTNTIHSRLLV